MGRIAPLQQNAEIEPGGVRSDASYFHSIFFLTNAHDIPLVMPGLVPGIHVFLTANKTWMAGTSPAMTWRVCASISLSMFRVLRRCQHAAVAGERRPGAEHLERVADDGGLVAQHGPAELGLEPHRHRL